MLKLFSRRSGYWFATLLLCAAVFSVPARADASSAGAHLPVVQPVASCASLGNADLTGIGGPGSKVVSAKETTKDGVSVCAVSGVLAPTIGFKAFLPTRSWAQRYLQIGCGGLCGQIPQTVGAADGCVPLADGAFVTAATDMGHEGQGGEFARDVQKRADFAHRANHVTALAAKALTKLYYGRSPAYSYFSGCSDGGREALIEAQRYPTDFNGIIAGAAAMNFEVQNSLYHGWQGLADIGPDGKPIMLASRLPLLHRAVLAKCDALDGLKDGLISDPRICHFDPAGLQCKDRKDKSDPNCLSAAEVAVVKKLYDGPRDPGTGIKLTIGGPQFGSELAWAGLFVPADASRMPMSQGIALDALRNIIFSDNPPADYKITDLKFDLKTFNRLRAHHPLLDATNPDLSAFAGSGGKLILWHGWADQHISPLNTIAYHEAVERTMGKAKSETFERLYLLPGVYHCGGGEGPSQIDILSPMMNWVEKGKAPGAILTRQDPKKAVGAFGLPPGGKHARAPEGASAGVVRTRPVYPYPAVARYSGHGDENKASSFVPGAPLTQAKSPAWAGTDFYSPYTPDKE